MSNQVESEIESLNYVIKQAQKAGNMDDVLYLQGLTEKIKNGDMFTPRNYVMKYGGSVRLIDNPDGDNLGILLSSEYNLLDLIRYNRGLAYSQKFLLKDILKNSLPTNETKLELPVYFVMGKYDYMTTSNEAKNILIRLKPIKKNLLLLSNQRIIHNLKRRKNFMNGCAIHF